MIHDEPTLRTTAPTATPPIAAVPSTRLSDDVKHISVPLDRVRPHANVRTIYDRIAVAELAATIRQHGLIHRPLFRAVPGGDYELIIGSRRYEAYKYLAQEFPTETAWTSIPADVRDIPDEAIPALQFIENDKREELTVVEVVAHVVMLKTALKWDDATIANKLGWKNSRTVRQYVQIADLPDHIKRFGTAVPFEIPKRGKDGEVLRDSNGVKLMTTKQGTPLGLRHLIELASFHSAVSKHDYTQRALDENYTLQADRLGERYARNASLEEWSVDRLKAALQSALTKLTGKSPEGGSAHPKVQAVTHSPTKLRIDLTEIKEPLPKDRLMAMKADIVSVLSALGYKGIILTYE